MGFSTKSTVMILRRAAGDIGESCAVFEHGRLNLDVVSMLLTGPRGLDCWGDVLYAHQHAVADVGEDKAFNEAVKAARRGAGPDVGAQDLAERVLGTFLWAAHDDGSLPERLDRATSHEASDKDERDLQEFFGVLAREQVRGLAGNQNGFDRVTDMFTAREMFIERYDRVVAEKGEEAVQHVTVDHARLIACLSAEIFGIEDIEGTGQDAVELIRSFLAGPR